MTCNACGDAPKKKDNSFTKAVVEINNPETLILFRKVVIPTSMGDETAVPAAIGKYHNVLLVYEANNHAYLYSSDGIPTLLTSDVAQDIEEKIDKVASDLQTETTNRQDADTALGNRVTAVEGIAATALQPADIDRVVTADLAVDPAVSTSTVQLNESKVNLASGTTLAESVVLPVASSTQAGVMNSSTYDAVTNNTNSINAIMNGAVAITGIAASPSQSDLTTAWQTETGLTTLINRASIYDVDNNKVWTYYLNSATWYAASNTSQVSVSTFTNSSEGTILGSTNAGQVFAESNGTGSVNGWDTLSGTVADHTSKLATIAQGAEVNVQANWDEADASSDAYIQNKPTIPTVNNATLTIQKNGSTVQTFTANSSTDKIANIEVPVITMRTTDPGEGSALAANNYIGVYGGDSLNLDYSTAEVDTGVKWIDGSSIYKKTIDTGTLPNASVKSITHGISNLNRIIRLEGYAYRSSDQGVFPLPFVSATLTYGIALSVSGSNIQIVTGIDRSNITESYVTLYYTKSS